MFVGKYLRWILYPQINFTRLSKMCRFGDYGRILQVTFTSAFQDSASIRIRQGLARDTTLASCRQDLSTSLGAGGATQ